MAKINKDDLKIGVTFTSCKDCDRVEVAHSWWEEVYTCGGERLWAYSCSRCTAEHSKKSNFCPNCGALMRRERNE